MFKLTFTEDPDKKDPGAHPLAVIIGGRYAGEILNTATVGFKPPKEGEEAEEPGKPKKKKHHNPRDVPDIGKYVRGMKKDMRSYWEKTLSDALKAEEYDEEDEMEEREIKRIHKEEHEKEKLKKLKDSVHAHLDFDKEFYLQDGVVQPIPDDLWLDRSILYCFGQSGSGKTTFVRKWVEVWKKQPYNKGRNVYVISRLTEDTSLDSLKPVRVPIDGHFITAAPTKDAFEPKCMIIFDDIDTIPDRNARNAVYKLLSDLLEVGRHTKHSVCVTSHQGSNYGQTRTILNEANYIVSSVFMWHVLGGARITGRCVGWVREQGRAPGLPPGHACGD